MAITKTGYEILKILAARGVIQQGGSLLQIGEANFYGDISFEELAADIDRLPAERQDPLRRRFKEAAQLERGPSLFALAYACYDLIFQPTEVVSIDMGGPTALPIDLNEPCQLGRQFDTVINGGTAEHVFDIANVFRIIHDHCRPGGIMVHFAPFQGWVDHGFWNLQPTVYFDLAAANDYQLEFLAVEDVSARQFVQLNTREQLLNLAASDLLPANACLAAALRRTNSSPFRVPQQGIYDDRLSNQAADAWKSLR